MLCPREGKTRGLSHIKAASVFADAIAERSDSDGESEKEDATEPEGVYVDPRILPGFRYKVRHAGPGAQRYLFEGRAMTLQSIGLGYGKRLTFTGESLNFNDNYFWSDSDPNGFAFSLEAVREGDRLSIYGNNGNSKNTGIYIFVVHFFLQVVNGDVIKRVRVTMRCNVIYHHHSHGRVDYKLHEHGDPHGRGEKIRNEELWERAGQEPVAKQIRAEEVGLDWTTPQEASIQHHTPSPDMESAGGKGREAASQPAGGGTLRQSYVSSGPTGLEWQE
nr:hypothetical protein BaRGS_008291 [Batillaria attramentaria]